MPLHLDPIDVSADLEGFSSILIVSCPVCPPVSLAVQKNSPLIEFFKSGLKTGAFEDYVKAIREPLEQRGVRTGAFSIYAPFPPMCLWTEGQRNRLLKRARDYEAVLVLGCDSATYTVKDALKSTDCRVFQAMRMIGITNTTVKFRFPLRLELRHKTHVRANEEIEKASSQ